MKRVSKKHRKHNGDLIGQHRHILHRINDNRHQSSCLILSSVWKCFIIFPEKGNRKKIRNIDKSNMKWRDIEPTLGRWLTTTDWSRKRIFIKAILKTLNSLICNDWLQTMTMTEVYKNSVLRMQSSHTGIPKGT